MKILLAFILAFNSNLAFANCDFSLGITEKEDGYLYTKDCHRKVGRLLKDTEDMQLELSELKKSIDLKDLALKKSDEQLMMWRMETYEQHERLLKIDRMSDRERWLWFGIGILVMGGATYAAGQLR